MDIIEVGGKVYGVVITQDDAGAEIGLWCGDEQVACIVVDELGVSALTAAEMTSSSIGARRRRSCAPNWKGTQNDPHIKQRRICRRP